MKLIPEPGFPELKRDLKTGVWYVVKTAGKRKPLFKSTRERKSKVKARRIAMQAIAEWLGTPDAFGKAQFLFEDVAKLYIEKKMNRRKNTIVSAKLHVSKHLMPFFQGFDIKTVAERWESYIFAQKESNPKRRLFNDAKHFKGILKLAYEKGMVHRPPNIPNPDPKVDAGKEYSDAEIDRLLDNANADLKLQIKMAYLMGMRRSEILRVSWSRVDLGGGLVVLRPDDTKTKLGRQVPMHAEVWTDLELRKKTAVGQYVFQSPLGEHESVKDNKTAWRVCKRKAQVQGRFHDLRHTAVTRMLYKFNIPAPQVAAIVGMTLVVMQRYAHPKGKYLRSAMNAIQGVREVTLSHGRINNESQSLQ